MNIEVVCFYCIGQIIYSNFIDKGTQTQRGVVTLAKSHR